MSGWRKRLATDMEGLGDIPIGLTEVLINISGTPLEIFIRAGVTNDGTIFIGKTGILSDGTNHFRKLFPGDEVVLRYRDANNPIYAISDVDAQKIEAGALT